MIPTLALVLLVALVTNGTFVVGASAAPRIERVQPTALVKVNKISGSRPTMTTVQIPADVDILNPLVLASPHPDVVVDGVGEFVGIILIEDTDDPNPPAYILGQFGVGAFSPTVAFRLGEPAGPYEPWLNIDRGRYHLYFVPGQRHATVTLRFGELSGTTQHLVPHSRARYSATQMGSPTRTAAVSFDAAAKSADVGSSALVLQATWLARDSHIATTYESCAGAKHPAPKFSCKTGDLSGRETAQIDSELSDGPDIKFFHGAWFLDDNEMDRREVEISFSLRSISPIKSVESVALWLTLE